MTKGIKDKVAVIGVGCTKFGERWDVGPEELIGEAFKEAIQDAGIDPFKDIEAAWLGTSNIGDHVGPASLPLSIALHLPTIPITRVENFCATGQEAIRGAAYAIAAGVYDITMALGVEKLKDTGFAGLSGLEPPLMWMMEPRMVAAGYFAQLATAYFHKYNVDPKRGKEALARISAKSHYNGSFNPKAHLRKALTVEQIMGAPILVWPLGLFDCCGVSDGAACAILCRADLAKKFRKDPIYIKSLQVAVGSGAEREYPPAWDGTSTASGPAAAARAYAEAGIKNPREEISVAEVHDCFSITEAILMEDLMFSSKGHFIDDVFAGRFNMDGAQPVNISGGLKSNGHPVGATGIRQCYEMCKQFQGTAQKPERQLKNLKLGLCHNLGGDPSKNVTGISIYGPELG